MAYQYTMGNKALVIITLKDEWVTDIAAYAVSHS